MVCEVIKEDIPKTEVMVVDFELSVMECFAKMLDREERLHVGVLCSTGKEALRRFRRHPADMVILELALPELSGMDLIAEVRKLSPTTRFLIFTGSTNSKLIWAGINCHPDGFFHKTDSWETTLRGILAVCSGHSAVGPYVTKVRKRGNPLDERDELAPQQRAVLRLLAEGKTAKEIADDLNLSSKTVENYRASLSRKLGIRDIASLTKYAIRHGLVDLD